MQSGVGASILHYYYKLVRSAYSISLHKRIMCPPCDMSPLCFANPETFGSQRCYLLPHVTFVQSLFAKASTKMDMSPKCVCPVSIKTAENNWKFLCAGKAWLIIVTWHQKVQMTKNWTCHLCAVNSRHYNLRIAYASNLMPKSSLIVYFIAVLL